MLSLLEKNRSYRRFFADRPVPADALLDMARAVRLSGSAGNLQRIRLVFINEPEECARVFSTLRFAAYLKDWDGPAPDERPTAYAVFLTEAQPDKTLGIDIGIAAQSLLLTASERGLGGCIFGSFSAEGLAAATELYGLVPAIVVALGVPRETAVVTDVKDGDIKYYREADGTHTVPKRALSEIVLRAPFDKNQ
ncbi:MAG: nitroreductase family protein [Clostridia bacterium]|nr:nitroreductase family protein [Clostridia bacterium]